MANRKLIYLIIAILLLPFIQACSPTYERHDHHTSKMLLEILSDKETFPLESPSLTPSFKLTDTGIDMLKTFEGEVRCKKNQSLHCPYDDIAGFCTIGHGHLIAKNNCKKISDLLSDLGFSRGITENQSRELLIADLSIAQNIIESQMSERSIGLTEITRPQYDSLVSFTFNVGGANFLSSTLLKELKFRQNVNGNPGIVYEFSRWIHAGGKKSQGLANRREKEIKHFYTGFEEAYRNYTELGETLEIDEEFLVDIYDGENE